MYCARDKSRGFTLIEVMLAVLIMALVAFAIYRFVESSLNSIKVSTEDTTQKAAMQGLIAVLSEEFCSLPAGQANALQGEAHEFTGKDSDQVTWLAQAGNGLFTEAASGTWKVTLLLRQQKDTYTLGILRQVPDNRTSDENWVPLLPNVDAIQVRYFDPRVNSWLKEWTDAQARPSLVRLRIWRADQPVPYEAVIELPPTKLPS